MRKGEKSLFLGTKELANNNSWAYIPQYHRHKGSLSAVYNILLPGQTCTLQSQLQPYFNPIFLWTMCFLNNQSTMCCRLTLGKVPLVSRGGPVRLEWELPGGWRSEPSPADAGPRTSTLVTCLPAGSEQRQPPVAKKIKCFVHLCFSKD